MVPPKDTISTENVVGSSSIEQELDLETLADDLDEVSYDPGQFPGVIYRIEEPKATCLIFRSGKVVCTGAQSIDDLTEAVSLTFETLQGLGLEIPAEPEVEIQNIVSSADLSSRLNLNAIAIGLGLEHVEYEPEQFPGLVYRLEEMDVVVLLFGSGKIVITGGSRPEDAEVAFDRVESRLFDLDLLE
ncbi:TATA-box-binding protein [Halostella sp. JP-L12]|uniref:TATA-box-binding protein n=1 Tax=Halostella TaxID=1843185 RepID=UPI000EF7F735|nr:MULTISPECIES: TATA-box-binding protein [Halostella]NHN48002.1 TATA-box-binding protein [Halostella sp. JP-L12]